MASNANASPSSMDDDTMKSLLPLMIGENDYTNTSQLQHRLNILQSWLDTDNLSSSSSSTAASFIPSTIKNSTILEIGCGQGDMTILLAHHAKRVLAVDPAPLDYGSPMTLGEAQKMISQDKKIGHKIEWVSRDPIEFLRDLSEDVEFVVLAHSIFYLASEEYLVELLGSLARFFVIGGKEKKKKKKKTRLLVAEWGMRVSVPGAEAHVLAARAQATNLLTDGNVRTLVLPERIRELAGEATWKMEKEVWIVSPDLEDGKWEVGLARTMAYEEKVIDAQGADFLQMERVVERLGGVENVCSMDVWTGVFAL